MNTQTSRASSNGSRNGAGADRPDALDGNEHPPAGPLSLRIHNFLEHPSTTPAYLVQGFVMLLIIASLIGVVISFWFQGISEQHKELLHWGELGILAVFSIEYMARFVTAPDKRAFVTKPLNVIDLVAILPGYAALVFPLIPATNEIRIVRLIRLLRFARVLRVLRLDFFGKLFQYQNTILQAISPILVLFMMLKSVMWLLEWLGVWTLNADLGELFAIIGFALGIVLAQKVAATYDKFLKAQDAAVMLPVLLSNLATLLDYKAPEQGSKAVREWARVFMATLRSNDFKHMVSSQSSDLARANRRLYDAVAPHEPGPADLGNMYAEIVKAAWYLLSQKRLLTPKPYDSLLRQATVLYICLLVVFIPGWGGLLSVALGTYVLYGMFHLTQDLDSVFGGEFRLISIDLDHLRGLAGEIDTPAGPEAALAEASAQISR